MGCTSSTPAPHDAPPPKMQEQQHSQAPFFHSPSFVTARDGSLFLDNEPFRFASLNAPELLDGDVNGPFEWRDTMQSLGAPGAFARAVTRTYTLRIRSNNIARGHINGWNSEWGDWEWDEGRLREIDGVLDEAAKAGVRLIIPLVNQDCGSQDTNWVGDTTDLVRYRKGIATYEEAKKVDWWTDLEMINSFKLIIDKLLNRINTLNGRRYGDDPTVLAWETGNEMNYRGNRAAPPAWTITIAKHLKSRAPNTLVMDGSFARTDNMESCFPREVLESDCVDIVSYHYYGFEETKRLKKDCELARKYGKVFIAGEYGFYSTPKEYATFLSTIDSAGGAGSLIWSLRPHSSQGGFKTHGEGDGQWSYHIPGWNSPHHAEFDPREASIISAIRTASYALNRLPLPPFPVPHPPSKPWLNANGTLFWRGSAWAERYEIVRRGEGGEERWEERDCTKEGCLGVGIGNGARVSVRAVGVDGGKSAESEELVV